MQVGDLVRYDNWYGVITCLDPEEIGAPDEVEVLWTDGSISNISSQYAEVISESR
jgi:hypothetical protein